MSNENSKPAPPAETLDVRIRTEEKTDTFYAGQCYGYRQCLHDVMLMAAIMFCVCVASKFTIQK